MNDPTQVAEIVAGLSEAQKRFLLEIPCYAVESYPPAKWLVIKRLAERTDTGHVVPTWLGEQAAAHLKGTSR